VDSRMSTFERTKHPLIVVAITTLLGSVLIPLVNSNIATTNRMRERRDNLAIDAIRYARETDRRLNLVLTEFGNYAKDQPRRDKASRAALRERVINLYAEFDREGWWWYWPLLQELRLMKLVDHSRANSISAEMDSYAANLKASTRTLDPLWGAFISSNTPRETADSTSFDLVSSRLDELQSERQEILSRMVGYIVN
jgi:hypothetical protein